MTENLHERIVTAANEFAMIAFDSAAKVELWSPGAERLFGITAAEAAGTTAEEIFTPEDRVVGNYERELSIAATEGRADDDRWHLRRDGSRFWASGVLTSVRDKSGAVVGFVKVIRDKSDERRMQESLRSSEEQFARLFLGNPAATVVIRQATGDFMLANEAFFRLTGHWRSEALGRSAADLHVWDPAQFRKLTAGAIKEQVESAVIELRTKAGEVRRCVTAISTTMLDSEECFVVTLIPLHPA